MTMTRPAKQSIPQHPECPHWCTRDNIGWHAHDVGLSESGDKVVIRLVRGDSTPLISVDRVRSADLNGLTFTQARALADLLVDGDHADGELVSLLYRAVDLITKRRPRPHSRSVAMFLLRIFGRKAVA